MQKQEYLDFELRIEKKGQRYEAAVVHSPAGEAAHLFKRPFSDLELENFILRMGGTRRRTRRISSPEMEVARQFGSKLFQAVFGDDLRACFISSQNEARRQGVGLRLKLRLEAPELVNIPWEYLYDTSLCRFLAQFKHTPIVRYLDVREPVLPLAVKPPLSILVMVSSPSDYPQLDVTREQANLQESLGELVGVEMVTLTFVEKATLPALSDCLLRGRYHVFHYIGHGGFEEISQDGVVVLEDENRLGQWVSGERLAVLLGNHPTLRLVILNACEGARTSRDDPFAGTATTLVRTGGVPAVVAMQFAITDEAAIIFARGFYNALSLGWPVDAAVTEARLAIFAAGNDVEWGTPVLYMRAPDGHIFDVVQLTPEERAVRQRAAEAARAEAEAQVQLERQEAEERTRRQVEARQAELARFYTVASEAAQAGNWSKAIESFQAVVRLDPSYYDAPARLAQAQEALAAEEAARQREAQLAKLYAQGLEHLQAQRWPAAIEGFRAVVVIDPDYGDPAHGSAASLLARAQQQKELASQLHRARQELVATLLARVQQQKELAQLPRPPTARPGKPTTLPEEIRPRSKPKDLPK